jgi:hypothetical protein
LGAALPFARPLEGNPVKRSIVSLSLSALLALAAGSALADTYAGEVTKVDRYSKSVEVRGGEHNRKQLFFLARGAQVTRGGQPVAIGDLKRGDRVEVDFTRKGSTHTARSVALVSSESAEAIATRE